MLRNVVQYKDFDGVNQTETVYFNLTKTELMDNLYLQQDLEALSNVLNPANSDNPETFTLTIEDVQKVLDMVKKLAKLSYGVRSDDGKRFIKGDKVWEEFTQTATYDAWLFELFTDIEKATAWMVQILPEDLKTIAEQGIAEDSQTVRATALRSVENTSLPEPTPDEDNKPFWEYSDGELLGMSNNEFSKLIQRSKQGNNIPPQLLVIKERRRAQN